MSEKYDWRAKGMFRYILLLLQRGGNDSLQGISEGRPSMSLAPGLSQGSQVYLMLLITLSDPLPNLVFAGICVWRFCQYGMGYRIHGFLYTSLATVIFWCDGFERHWCLKTQMFYTNILNFFLTHLCWLLGLPASAHRTLWPPDTLAVVQSGITRLPPSGLGSSSHSLLHPTLACG